MWQHYMTWKRAENLCSISRAVASAWVIENHLKGNLTQNDTVTGLGVFYKSFTRGFLQNAIFYSCSSLWDERTDQVLFFSTFVRPERFRGNENFHLKWNLSFVSVSLFSSFTRPREYHHSLLKYTALSCWPSRTPVRFSSEASLFVDRSRRTPWRSAPSRGNKAPPSFLAGKPIALECNS